MPDLSSTRELAQEVARRHTETRDLVGYKTFPITKCEVLAHVVLAALDTPKRTANVYASPEVRALIEFYNDGIEAVHAAMLKAAERQQ